MFPGVHVLEKVHGPPAGPGYPTLHVQAVTDELELGEMEFAGHVVHAAEPTVSLYVPVLQAVHDPVGPVYPTAQPGSTQAVAPAPFVCPAGQVKHVLTEFPPAKVEYLPAAQSTHAVVA